MTPNIRRAFLALVSVCALSFVAGLISENISRAKPPKVETQAASPNIPTTSYGIVRTPGSVSAVRVPCDVVVADASGECWVSTLTGSSGGALYSKRDADRASRRASRIWPELMQIEVDTITAGLKGLKKRPVTALCDEERYCGDIALDLENAFESAGWVIDVQRPIASDGGSGITVDDEGVGSLLQKATGSRMPITVTVGAPPVNSGNFTTIAIGKRAVPAKP